MFALLVRLCRLFRASLCRREIACLPDWQLRDLGLEHLADRRRIDAYRRGRDWPEDS